MLPPAASTRKRCEARPTWPEASASASRSGGKPAPSSSTTSTSSPQLFGKPHGDLGCVGVLHDVRQELARGGVDELLLWVALLVPEVES